MPAITAKRMQNSATGEANLHITPSYPEPISRRHGRADEAGRTARPQVASARHRPAGSISCHDNIPSIFYRFADTCPGLAATDPSQISRDVGFLPPQSNAPAGSECLFAAISRRERPKQAEFCCILSAIMSRAFHT
jgi:hypothetical protein